MWVLCLPVPVHLVRPERLEHFVGLSSEQQCSWPGALRRCRVFFIELGILDNPIQVTVGCGEVAVSRDAIESDDSSHKGLAEKLCPLGMPLRGDTKCCKQRSFFMVVLGWPRIVLCVPRES